MNYYIGIDIGGTKIAYGLVDEKKELLLKKKTPSDDQKGGEVRGIGIWITGFVDFEKGALTRTASLPKLNHFAVVDYLKGQLRQDIQIVMDNDCHCGALAEYRCGAGRGIKVCCIVL